MLYVCLSHRILNKIKENTIFPILWVNEVSANKACISLKQLGPAKAHMSNKAAIITLVLPYVKDF